MAEMKKRKKKGKKGYRSLLTLGAILLLQGCLSRPAAGPMSPSSSVDRQDGPVLVLVLPGPVEPLRGFIRKAVVNLSKEFGVPWPIVKIHMEMPMLAWQGWYIAGLYEPPETHQSQKSGIINVWARSPAHDQVLGLLEETFLHEWIHHYDEFKGIDPPKAAHNELFRKRIDEMGLWGVALR